MNRRTLLSSLAAMLLLTVMALANGSAPLATPTPASGSAPFNERQVRWCASGCYTVEVASTVGCSPCIRTSWNGGAVTWPAPASSCYAPGSNVTECPTPAQPFGTVLDWVNVCGVVLPGLQGQYVIPAGACPGCPQLCVRLCVGASGCLQIHVTSGACPASPPPCP